MAMSEAEIKTSAQEFVAKVLEQIAFGWFETVVVNGKEYDQVDMRNARDWTPSHLTGNRFPSEEEADRQWYAEVEQLCEKHNLWLVVEKSGTQVERWDLLVRKPRNGRPVTSKRSTATTADAMRERFMGESITTERVRKGTDRVAKSGKAAAALRYYTGLK